MNLADRFEYCKADDRFANYCLWDYDPVSAVERKFRSVNLLYQSFDLAGLDERCYRFVDDIRRAIGEFRTVWGLKKAGDSISWEFYFYDYMRRKRDVSMTRVVEAMAPYVRCELPIDENLPYFMFSIDIDGELVAGGRGLDEIHMYVGNSGSTVSSGIAYSVTRESTDLENFYFFFDGRRQLADAAEKIASSAFVDTGRIGIDRILLPELRDCRTICVANKQKNDCVYFSEIDVTQLLFFLKRLDYPAEIVGFVEANRANLDHLLYDVGLDYRMEDGELVVSKSGYYGVF